VLLVATLTGMLNGPPALKAAAPVPEIVLVQAAFV
jgi:hypothetical protein